MLRFRSMTFFTLVNPSMKNGGLYAYSKSEILSKVDPDFRPKEIIIKEFHCMSDLNLELKKNGFQYPIIIKPDKGERGKGVYYIQNAEQMPLNDSLEDYIVQEYIDLPLEIGIFYIKIPGKKKGQITSLMKRELLKVIGNGKTNVEQLLNSDPRKKQYIETVGKFYRGLLEKIPGQDEEIVIEPVGNHNRGTVFLDYNHKINEKLCSTIDHLIKDVPGFYYGRLDIRTASWNDLYSGKNLKVLEINGMNSEPAHIYQPGYSIFKAYKVIFEHWNLAYKIARENKKKGLKAESFTKTLSAYLAYLRN